MANLKEVRTRIASVSSTQQITSAMKMVSAAKFRRAQNAIIGMRPYADQLREIIADIDTAADTFQITLMDYCEFETNDGVLELFSPNFSYIDENADSISYSYTIDGDTLNMVYSGTEQTETYQRTEDKPIFIKDNKTEETTE